jgi:antimicrobial peptide system SdpB family protein
MALCTFATLVATPGQVLLIPTPGDVPPMPACHGIDALSAWCVIPHTDPDLPRWLLAAALVVVAVGWRPAWTAIPHWWISWSVATSISVPDGGDNVVAVLTLLLLPALLTDPRRWHWRHPDPGARGPVPRLLAGTSLFLVKLQMAGLYLDAGLGKLRVPEWVDGTAMWYFFRTPVTIAPGWLTPITDWITKLPIGVAALTWGAVILEVVLGIALLLPQRVRPALLVSGLVFHDIIAVSMGLISFDMAMAAGLLLYLLPMGHQLAAPMKLHALIQLQPVRRGPARRIPVAEASTTAD